MKMYVVIKTYMWLFVFTETQREYYKAVFHTTDSIQSVQVPQNRFVWLKCIILIHTLQKKLLSCFPGQTSKHSYVYI